MLLSNSEFLKELTNLFQSKQVKGSIFLISKRYTYEPAIPSTESINVEDGESEDVKMNEFNADASGSGSVNGKEKEYPFLIRASDGQDKKSKVKISTVVQPEDYEQFTINYGQLLKSTMSTSLKKKKKSKSIPSTSTTTSTTSTTKSKPATSNPTTSPTTTKTGKLVLPKIVGPSRGAGIKKRIRIIKKRDKIKSLWKQGLLRKQAEQDLVDNLIERIGY